uniref:Uncharacterized protein n=1 Tax=Rhizophora mucronata TaxID=61149 RepID=A0A2P2KCL5_RHIMU
MEFQLNLAESPVHCLWLLSVLKHVEGGENWQLPMTHWLLENLQHNLETSLHNYLKEVSASLSLH